MKIKKFILIIIASFLITFFIKMFGLIKYESFYNLIFIIEPIILYVLHRKRVLPINLIPIFNGLAILGIPLMAICLFESITRNNFAYSFLYSLGLIAQTFGLAELNKSPEF